MVKQQTFNLQSFGFEFQDSYMKAIITSYSRLDQVTDYGPSCLILGKTETSVSFDCFGDDGTQATVELKGTNIGMFGGNSEYEIEIKIKEIPKIKAREIIIK